MEISNELAALEMAFFNKIIFDIQGERMTVVSCHSRKGVTEADEVIAQVKLKSVANESQIMLTGSPGKVLEMIKRLRD